MLSPIAIRNVVIRFMTFRDLLIDVDIKGPEYRKASSAVSPCLIKVYQIEYELSMISKDQKKKLRRMRDASVLEVRVLGRIFLPEP
jgi:hypothetical protein